MTLPQAPPCQLTNLGGPYWVLAAVLVLCMILRAGGETKKERAASGSSCGTAPLVPRPDLAGISREQAFGRARALSLLGRKMFFDPSLSGSGKMSCASCHSPQRAFGPPNNLSTQAGGKDLRQPGMRAVPSLKYLQAAPQFTEHFFDAADEGNESVDNGPTGGLSWDGRND